MINEKLFKLRSFTQSNTSFIPCFIYSPSHIFRFIYHCYTNINAPHDHKQLFQDTLNVCETKDLGTYLGFPLSHKRPRRKDVQFVVDKVKRKLSLWKSNYLSRAGKLTLIKSTLNSMPAYYLQSQTFPVASIKELDQTCNDFLWGETNSQKRIHLIGKDSTFLPKSQGGLGIRSHFDLSTIYMARLGWKISHGPKNLAQECIDSKYVLNNRVIPFKHGSKIWKSIGMGWDLLNDNKVWVIGNGSQISVWEDNWLGIGSIRSLIEGPLTHSEQNITLRDLGESGRWNLSLISYSLPDFISHRILEFPLTLDCEKSDHPVSSFVDNGKFSMTKAYATLTLPRKPLVDLEWLWKGTTSPKIKFFLWLLWWDRLPTKKLLHQRHIAPSNLCPLCLEEIESSFHIVRNCRIAKAVWQISPLSHLPCQLSHHDWMYHHLKHKDHHSHTLTSYLFPFLCWELWTQRNKFIFENIPVPQPNITLHRATKKAQEVYLAHPALGHQLSQTSPILLKDPPWQTIIVDASFINLSSPSCIAGVLFDNTGKWRSGFQRRIFANDSLHAELLGVFWALSYAKDQELAHIDIFTDCIKATQLIHNPKESNPVIDNVAMLCRDQNHAFQEMKIQFCPRKLTQVAEKLARQGRREEIEMNVTRNIPNPPVIFWTFGKTLY